MRRLRLASLVLMLMTVGLLSTALTHFSTDASADVRQPGLPGPIGPPIFIGGWSPNFTYTDTHWGYVDRGNDTTVNVSATPTSIGVSYDTRVYFNETLSSSSTISTDCPWLWYATYTNFIDLYNYATPDDGTYTVTLSAVSLAGGLSNDMDLTIQGHTGVDLTPPGGGIKIKPGPLPDNLPNNLPNTGNQVVNVLNGTYFVSNNALPMDGTLALTLIIGFALIVWGMREGEYQWMMLAGFVWIFAAITVLLQYGLGWMVIGLGIGLTVLAEATVNMGHRKERREE